MTKKREDAAPRAVVIDRVRLPAKRRGWLICDQCERAIEFVEGAPEWPQHRCLNHEVRPFDRWTDEDPRPPWPIPGQETA